MKKVGIDEQIKKLAGEIEAQGLKSICFWMPAKNVGGGTYYFYCLGKYLLDHTNLKLYYMDYPDGYAHDLFQGDERITFLEYSLETDVFPLAEPVLLFTNSTKIIQFKHMHPQSRILLWHFETVPCAWEIVLMNQETKRFLKLTQKNNAMTFLDWASRISISKQFGIDFKNKDYLPVFLDQKEMEAPKRFAEAGVLRIGWLGRLSKDKVNSLYNLIDNCARLKVKCKKKLVIIGDGVCRKEVEDYCASVEGDLEVFFTGTIDKEHLDDFLVNCVDILFAMGTSVLEGAALKIPSVVVQLGTKKFFDDDYIWLYDTAEYCVGIMHEQKKDFPVTYSKFDQIIQSVLTEEGKTTQGDKCYRYFVDNHSNVGAITLAFLKFCKQTTLTFEQLEKCIKYIPYNKMKIVQWQSHRIPIWTIITHNNEKTYKLFGLTLMKLIWSGDDKIYIPFGIRPVMHKYTRSGYQFPNSTFKDNVRGVGRVNVMDRKNAMAYKKKQNLEDMRERVAKGEKLRVCLFVSRISCWNFERLYEILDNSPYFEPTVVVKPFMYQGEEAMADYMETTYNALASKGYRILKGYDHVTGRYLDLRQTLNPDVVFYTKYWDPQFHENFFITNFLDKVTFYTSYCFDIADHPAVMNFDLNNAVDRYFMPSSIHKRMAEGIMRNGAKNVHVTGAPKLDMLLDSNYKAKQVWKPQLTPKKRIIWAPHHSDAFPNDLYQFNAFFELYKFMLVLAERYQDSVQFAFKPHPMLKPKLDEKWGKEEADRYYACWEELENGQLETGEFIDLFKTSDAMIMDSISFIAEYTAVNKPALFTIGRQTRVKLNEFGMINFDVLYKTENSLFDDIVRFVEDVVIGGNDIKREEREAFIQQYLAAPGGKDAAQVIYENMCDEILNGERLEK